MQWRPRGEKRSSRNPFSAARPPQSAMGRHGPMATASGPSALPRVRRRDQGSASGGRLDVGGIRVIRSGRQWPRSLAVGKPRAAFPHLMKAPMGGSRQPGPAAPNQGSEVADLHARLVPDGKPRPWWTRPRQGPAAAVDVDLARVSVDEAAVDKSVDEAGLRECANSACPQPWPSPSRRQP